MLRVSVVAIFLSFAVCLVAAEPECKSLPLDEAGNIVLTEERAVLGVDGAELMERAEACLYKGLNARPLIPVQEDSGPCLRSLDLRDTYDVITSDGSLVYFTFHVHFEAFDGRYKYVANDFRIAPELGMRGMPIEEWCSCEKCPELYALIVAKARKLLPLLTDALVKPPDPLRKKVQN